MIKSKTAIIRHIQKISLMKINNIILVLHSLRNIVIFFSDVLFLYVIGEVFLLFLSSITAYTTTRQLWKKYNLLSLGKSWSCILLPYKHDWESFELLMVISCIGGSNYFQMSEQGPSFLIEMYLENQK